MDISIYDRDESFTAGDTPIDEIDWDEVAKLETLQAQVDFLPEDERPLATLSLLVEMYGDELQVL